MRGLFAGPHRAQCSIYESGLMVYQALSYSKNYTLEYSEGPQAVDFYNAYDFVVFNWHHFTTPFFTRSLLQRIRTLKFAIVTECVPGNPTALTPVHSIYFDGYLVLDPTIEDTNNIWGMPRPLEVFDCPIQKTNDIVTVGSFGFATVGKRFDLVLEGVAKEFITARVRFNIPKGTYVSDEAVAEVVAGLTQIKAANIQLEITHKYMTKLQLIEWCAENDLNVFLYYRDMPGLAAVTDQAISAQRPLLVSEDFTFRHIHKYMDPYPKVSFTGAMDNVEAVLKMYRDWSPYNFSKKFEEILNACSGR